MPLVVSGLFPHYREWIRMDCHDTGSTEVSGDRPVVLVGNPNVGKSALFARLTGHYVTVSNYPGTTVEVARGTLAGTERAVIDTPGIRSIVPTSDDERVSRDILLESPDATVVQVAEAQGLDRAAAAAALDDEALGIAVRMEEHRARENGINSVPTFVVNGRYILQGSHDADRFRQALVQIASMEAAA